MGVLSVSGLAWGQFALLFWAAVCLFAAGARQKKIPMTAKVWWEIVQAAFIVVVLFGLLTEGRGCASSTAGDPDILCVGETRC